MLEKQIIYALIGTGATCLATVLGAGMVFVFKKDMGEKMQKMFLGFAAGIMIAASVWSLLIPAMDMATEQGQIPALPVGIGACFRTCTSGAESRRVCPVIGGVRRWSCSR